MDQPVNITVVTHNRMPCTRLCLDSLARTARDGYSLTVIDNASTDGSGEYLDGLAAAWPGGPERVRVIRLERNMGVSCAYNLGWSLRDAPWYMKVDNDTEFLRPGWLDVLLDQAGRLGDAGMLGLTGGPAGVRAVDHIPGCVLVPRAAHERLGFWNEDYGLYGEEDADFGLRCRLAGLGCHAVSDGRGPFLRSSEALDPARPVYAAWKNEQRLENLHGMFPLNLALFSLGLRDLRVERLYRPELDGDGVRFRLDPEYVSALEALKAEYGPRVRELLEAARAEALARGPESGAP